MNAKQKQKRCPTCNAAYDATLTLCPQCQESSDSWETPDSMGKREETSAKALSSKPNAQFSKRKPVVQDDAAPVGAGYQGRQKDPKFEKTMGVPALTKPSRRDDSPQVISLERRESRDEDTSPSATIPTALPDQQVESQSSLLSLPVAMGIASAILIITWFIPDLIIAGQITSRMSMVKTSQGGALLGLLSQPACGALLLAFVIAPLKTSLRSKLGVVFGLMALAGPLLLATLALPINGKVVLLASVLTAAAGAIAFAKLKSPLLGHLLLLVLPTVLITMSMVNGVPIEHVASIKDPITIYAATLAVAASIPLLKQD